MTSAVLLCLCLLGLSYAAPNRRNVRWCVTSDAEDKKCHELANSCSVNEIHLLCVKKSSPEDCVKAISDGKADAISLDSEQIYESSLNPYKLLPIMAESYHFESDFDLADQSPCLKKRQHLLKKGQPPPGAFVPKCDEWGNYNPKQCHGSTGHCWCVNKEGEEIDGTRTPPGQQPSTCQDENSTHCLRHRQSMLGRKKYKLGDFIPECDEKGAYAPRQCHHGTPGSCWCVYKNGEMIEGTRTAPFKVPTKCEDTAAEPPCLKERQKKLEGKQPVMGAFVPQCDEKGSYSPRQCHGSTGYCWCVDGHGEEIPGTKTPPGQSVKDCGAPDPTTLHYAVAVVPKSSTLLFDQLKGKRSCHSAVGTAGGWIFPLYALIQKNLLVLEEHEEKSIEEAVSKFFALSCVPGATNPILCSQCAGHEDKCKRGPGEPYYGDEGAFRCLRDDKGDVAFVENTVLSEKYMDNYELLCPDNTRKDLSQYKDCHLGKVPTRAVVTRSTGDKTKDITEYLHGAEKNECKLFSSTHGKDLLFEDTTTSLTALPSAMNTLLFLGPELFNAIKILHGAPPRAYNEVRWCPLSRNEKLKCDDWSAVSGGAIKCTEPSSELECIEKVLKGEADVVTLHAAHHTYAAVKCGLVPALEEYHNKDELAPCKTRGAQYTDFGEARAVALVKKSDKDITWNNLKGKKSCHTGVGHTAGWIIPFSLINKQTKNCDLGSFFSQSCAPGSPIDSNLCELCIGDPQNPQAGTKCSPSDKEAYYGNEGAMRCLVEKGDVAFVPHLAMFENTDGKNTALWAKELKSTDFELLCPDGSRAPVTDYKKCKLSGVQSQSVMTRQDIASDVVRLLLNQLSLYGRNGFQSNMFQMFSSTQGQNLLFHDDTQCLIEFDRVKDVNILDDYFGRLFYNIMQTYNQCFPSALTTACSFHN